MIQDLTQYLLNKDHQLHKWQPQKSWTLFQDYQGRAGTSSRCSIRLVHMSKWKMPPTLLKIPKSQCPDIWILPPKHKWTKSWSSMEGPSRSSRKESVRSSLGKTFMGNSRKFRIANVYSLTEKKGTILVCVCGRYQTGWKETEYRSDLDNPHEKTLIWENQHRFLDHVYLGCTQRECQISKDIVDNYTRKIRIQDFCQGYRKIVRNKKPQRNLIPKQYLHGLMIWKVMQKKCVERYCELANKTTQQLYKVANTMHGWPSIERRGKWVHLENCISLLANCSQMSVFGTYWETWHFMVCE